jgi:hypothetical protein
VIQLIFFYNTPLSLPKFSYGYILDGVPEYNPVEKDGKMDRVADITYSEHRMSIKI